MKNKHIYIKIFFLIVMALLVTWFVIKFNIIQNFNIDAVKDYINSFGENAAIVFILIFSIRTLLVIFPCSVVIILGGSIFGPIMGFVNSMIGIFISASLAFLLSRYMGKGFVQKILRGKADRLDMKVGEHGFKIIFFMRISIIFPYDIMNFAAGLTKVKYKDFILGTLLGIAPETFALNYLGDNIRHPLSSHFLLALALVAMTIAIPFIYNKSKQKKA